MIDWQEQWALFAANFKEGKAHIPVGEKTLLLIPGPGFGDCSHPTTQLMLAMMPEYVAGESVVDIGTGSGILALAALLLKARSATGIDIDPEAVQHAKQNGEINGLKATFATLQNSQTLAGRSIFLMNMILSEQQQVAPQRFNPLAKLWLVSGILQTQKQKYLRQAKEWSWRLVAERQQSEWLGFIFQWQQQEGHSS